MKHVLECTVKSGVINKFIIKHDRKEIQMGIRYQFKSLVKNAVNRDCAALAPRILNWHGICNYKKITQQIY